MRILGLGYAGQSCTLVVYCYGYSRDAQVSNLEVSHAHFHCMTLRTWKYVYQQSEYSILKIYSRIILTEK